MLESSSTMNLTSAIIAAAIFFSPLFHCPVASARDEIHCSAILPCPVLNTPDFGSVFGGADGKTVKVDKKGLIRELEFIALPETSFSVISRRQTSSHDILEVQTSDYPSEKPLFIDSRFVVFSKAKIPERVKRLLPAGNITSAMMSMKGRPYMWGGNYFSGIGQMIEFYPPKGKISSSTRSLWRLEGVDCSGLVYQASAGYTPRNTSSMLTFGKGLNISGSTAEEIAGKLRPLDLIVWKGHVVIVLDGVSVIESRHPEGVVISDLTQRLRSIMSERTPQNNWDGSGRKSFVVRRWYAAE